MFQYKSNAVPQTLHNTNWIYIIVQSRLCSTEWGKLWNNPCPMGTSLSYITPMCVTHMMREIVPKMFYSIQKYLIM
jgi:hypothetical protein